MSVTAEGPGWSQHGLYVISTPPHWLVFGVPSGPCTVKARLDQWSVDRNDPDRTARRVGPSYAAAAEGIEDDVIRMTLREVAD